MLKKRCLSICLTVLSILILTLSTAQTSIHVIAASPPSKALTGYIPSAVTGGQALLIGQHPGTDQLALAIGLPLRNQQALIHLLHEVSTPRNPQYRHYLTQAQANQAFNPTLQQEQQVISWLKSHGLTVTQTYPNHLLVDITGTFAQIEQVFHVAINDYTMQLDGKQITFYAPANEPTVDSSVSNAIDTLLGLDDYPSFQVDASPAIPTRPAGNGTGHGSPPYYPQDFANAYDVKPLWKAGDTGVGQHIGIVLAGPAPSDATLVQFHQVTGANVATRAKTYGPWLQVIPVDKGPYVSSKIQAEEAGTDVESSSGMAHGATIDYYEVPTDQNGNATALGLEHALNLAGMDANNNQQISNSWHRECEPTQEDAFIQKTEQILLSNSATGHNYFFSSGDTGSQCGGKNPLPQYPASSAYVTSIGGTHFSQNINGSYRQETAWSGSGGGYSILFPEPSWQANAGIPDPNTMRGLPDVAADAAQSTGAYICYDGSNGPTCIQVGGTSLATPLWAGMIADVNQYVQSQNELPLGFINPLLYEIAFGSNSTPYAAFHDITKGSNGNYQANLGWDAVTGLGSPDLYNLARDAAFPYSSLSGIAAVSANDVWAVGSYNYNNYIQFDRFTLVEHWNGNSWQVVFSPNPGLYSNVLNGVAAVSTNNVWAVGSYGDPNLNQLTLIEQWNGNSWNVVPSPNPDPSTNSLSSVAVVSANDVWAVGSYSGDTLIEHWNGNSWNVVPSPNPSSYINSLSSVTAVSANDVWAVGSYLDSNSNPVTLIEHWNGNSWNVVPSPNPSPSSQYPFYQLSSVAVVSANDVWAVGSYRDSNDNQLTLIEQWNGNSWNVVPSPNPDPSTNSLSSVAVVSANDVWAVGDEGSGICPCTLTEHWNGSSWQVAPSPNPGPYGSVLLAAAAISISDVWAVGFTYNYNSNGYIPNLTEQWNGSSWNVVPSPN